MLPVSSINLTPRNINNQNQLQNKAMGFSGRNLPISNAKEDIFTTSVKDALKQMMKDPDFDKKMNDMYKKNKFKKDCTSPRESEPVPNPPDVEAFLAAGLPLEHAKDAANRLRNDGHSTQEIINAAKELQRISQQMTGESLNKEYAALQAELDAKATEVEAKKTATLDTEQLALTNSQT